MQKDVRPRMLCIAGFGDDATMFDTLRRTALAERFTLIPLDLPGFGARTLNGATNLTTLSDYVLAQAVATGATIIMAHSVASIIASLASAQPDAPIRSIISLEGNLTAEDAYFSGTAGDFDTPENFRETFLHRLEGMSSGNPIISRYADKVAQADPKALWELGCDARRFSEEQTPGDLLRQSAEHVLYLYNPENCPSASLKWLETSSLDHHIINDASHWPTIDQPEALADTILNTFRFKKH